MSKRLRNSLSETLPSQRLVHVCNSYDIAGDIASIRLTEASKECRLGIADAVMKAHKNIKTVLSQTSAVHGDFRLRRLMFVAGENGTITTYREWGCLFSVDVKKCYFSPRLSYERMRIAKQVGDGEVVLNMFAGVGCFSILIAKYSDAEKVYSIDVNPSAVRYMQENIRLNRVCGRVSCLLGNAEEIVEELCVALWTESSCPCLRKPLNTCRTLCRRSKKREDGFITTILNMARKKRMPLRKVSERLLGLGAVFDAQFGRIVRATGPNWYQIVLDIEAFEARRANNKCGSNERVL